MAEPPSAGRPLRFSRLIDVQLQAVEWLLNDLSRHGLRVGCDAAGRWWWAWHEQTARADGLGSAIIEATYWYFRLSPDPGDETAGDSEHSCR